MKRFLFWVVFLFVLAILIGLAIKSDPGYVLIAYHHWTAEMPLWFAVAVVIGAFMLIHYTVRSILAIKHLYRRWKRYSEYKSFYQSNQLFENGLLKLAENEWIEAESLFIKSVSGSKMPLVHYLLAAYAAKQRKDYAAQDEYLYQAHACNHENEFVLSLVQARSQLEQKQWELAQATLMRLQKMQPKHSAVLRLLITFYSETGDNASLLTLLPQLQKHKSIVEDVSLMSALYQKLFQWQTDLDSLALLWKKMPKLLKIDDAIVLIYAKMLIKFGEQETAAKFLANQIDKSWCDELVALYGSIVIECVENQLKIAESWLKIKPNNSTLLLTIAEIVMRLKHWAKAKEYLLLSLNILPNVKCYQLLGEVYGRLGEAEKSLDMYKKCAKLIACCD